MSPKTRRRRRRAAALPARQAQGAARAGAARADRRDGRARRAGPTSSSSRRCSRPRSSRATPPAPRNRIRHAAFPAHKTLGGLRLQRPARRREAADPAPRPARLDRTSTRNVCFFGPPGTGKTHLAIALAIKACQAGHRVAFATAQQWVDRLEQAQHRNALDAELRRLERYQPARRRRDRLPAARTPGREPALRPRRAPLRTRLDHRHQQPRLRGLGRDPRRRHGRRRPHRPARPPRPHDHPQRQELPAARAGHRRRAGGRDPARRPTADDLNHGRRTTPTCCTIRFLIAAALFGSC